MKLADFDVTIDAHYATEVRSPAGTAAGHLDLDLAAPQFQAALAQVRGLNAGRGTYQRFGSWLYDALFHDQVRECWQQSLTRTLDGGHAEALRVRLFIKDPALAALPWELLWSPERHFLATAPNISLARYVPVLEPPPALEIERLRLLVIVSNPFASPFLTATEAERFTSVLAQQTDCQVLYNPSVAEIQENLANHYHALHFLGYGHSQAIYLANATGGADPLDSAGVAQLLEGDNSVRVVTLNAGHSEQVTEAGFDSMGPALVRAGCPAVVALQYRAVALDAAITFSRAFYGALARGRAVDLAVNEGRQLMSAGPLLDNRDWNTPVLYLGTRSHEILRLRRASGAAAPRLFAPAAPVRNNDNRQRILTRLCSHQQEEQSFYEFLVPHLRKHWGVPQICLLRGGVSERHDSLIERLAAVGIREEAHALWGQASGVASEVEKLGWEFDDELPQRQDGLRLELFQAFQSLDETTVDLSATALRQALRARKIKFALVHHLIPAARWDKKTDALVKWYLSFWRELAETPDPNGPQFIIFLDFLYDDARATSFGQRLRQKLKLNRARKFINRHIGGIVARHTAPPLLSMKELSQVSAAEVKDWFHKYTNFDDGDVAAQTARIFPTFAGQLSLAEIERKLAEIPAAQLKEGAIDDVRNEFRFLRRQWHNT